MYEEQLPPGLLETIPSPALFVFMGSERANIATMLAHCEGDPLRWRPHLKTTKIAPVFAELLAAGVRLVAERISSVGLATPFCAVACGRCCQFERYSICREKLVVTELVANRATSEQFS